MAAFGLVTISSSAIAKSQSQGSIHGVVRADNGSAVAGANIVVEPLGGGRLLLAVTDAFGSFDIKGLEPGVYNIAAHTDSRSAVVRAVSVGTSHVRTVSLSLVEVTEEIVGPWLEEAERGTYSVGAETALISGAQADFGELVVFRPRVKIITSSAIFSVAVDLLAKGPEVADDKTLQSGEVGVLVALGSSGAARVRLSGGRQRFGLGSWNITDVSASWRRDYFEFFAVEGRLGFTTTALFNSGFGDQWIGEGGAGGKLLFTMPCIKSLGWVGANLSFPLAHSGGGAAGLMPLAEDGNNGGSLQPRSRLGLELGFELGSIREWDMHAILSFADRGDAKATGTTLPILVGGADQTQLIVGMARRFGASK